MRLVHTYHYIKSRSDKSSNTVESEIIQVGVTYLVIDL